MQGFTRVVAAMALAPCGLTQSIMMPEFPDSLSCKPDQTAGFHDFPHNQESYEPVSFFENVFEVRLNRVLMRHRDPAAEGDLFVTLQDEGDRTELTCRRIRGAGGDHGVSCSNRPPAEMLLINLKNLRFTRTSIGGWTFAAATENVAGDSIYVEYGICS